MNGDPEERYLRELKEVTQGLVDYVSAGSAESFEDYKFVCGKIQGLRLAVTSFEEIREEVEKQESL